MRLDLVFWPNLLTELQENYKKLQSEFKKYSADRDHFKSIQDDLKKLVFDRNLFLTEQAKSDGEKSELNRSRLQNSSLPLTPSRNRLQRLGTLRNVAIVRPSNQLTPSEDSSEDSTEETTTKEYNIWGIVQKITYYFFNFLGLLIGILMILIGNPILSTKLRNVTS